MYSHAVHTYKTFFFLNNLPDAYSQILKFLYIIHYEVDGKQPS